MLDIKKEELLSKYTTFHVGDPTKYFVIVKNVEELKEALMWAKDNQEKYFILGGGSNLLFADGFDGLVIKINFADIIIEDNKMTVGAGAPLFLAVKRAAEAGLAGLESFAGIPGTVGGAICNNAGAFGGSISDSIKKVELLAIGLSPSTDKIEIVDKDWFEFEYRKSKLKYWKGENKPIILRVWFDLKKENKDKLLIHIKKIMEERIGKEPKGFCAGCAFKNIKGEKVTELLDKFEFTPEERERFGSRKAIPTAWFIENAGLKGMKIGGAYIAEEHANYLMNNGTATADHILQLISLVKQKVRDKFGLQLEEEIQIIK